MKLIISSLLCLLLASLIHAQKPIDIKITHAQDSGMHSCYDIALKSSENRQILLAGQNYRLFYDAEKLNFVNDKSHAILDPRSYSALDVLNTENQGIGFLSLSVAGRKLTDKTINLLGDDAWVNTLYVCFERESDSDFDLTWAHDGKTGSFATAEVTMSEWLDKDHHQVLDINILEDYHSQQDIPNTSPRLSLNVYPNPMLDYVNIEFDDIVEPDVIIIKDIIGREVVYDNISGRQNLSYDLVNWPDGTYTIEILDNTSTRILSKKVIKAGR